jgi:hypothetical protein
MESCKFKEEKDCKEISTKVDVRYFWGKTFALGNILGISKKCMCIKSKYCFPVNSNIELFLKNKKQIIDIFATVRSYKKANFRNDTMCVEVLNPSQEYSYFVESLYPAFQKS